MFSAIWTRYGKVKMPKLKSVAFETAILEQYQHQESSVEEALIEMCLAGVSAQRVEAITEAVRGTKVSPGTISNLSKKVYGHIEKCVAGTQWGNQCMNMKHLEAICEDAPIAGRFHSTRALHSFFAYNP